MKRKLLAKAGVLVFALSAGVASAEVPAAITTMFSTFQADSLTVIGTATGLVAAVVGAWMLVQAAKKYIKGAK